MRIAILCHERDRWTDMRRWVIHGLAEVWKQDGHQVDFHFGAGRFEPADIAIVHVDLSVVPDPYLRLARRYPVALNAAVRDIRKTSISQHQLRPGEPWSGAVMVKSDLNYGGAPERRLRRFPRLAEWLDRWLRRDDLRGQEDYRVFETLDQVPQEMFRNPRIVVERFLPEREGELFCVRLYEFLGDRSTCIRLVGPHPIVNGSSAVRVEPIEVDPEVEARRRELGFDYGKFDYVVYEGRPVLLDVNKTTGAGGLNVTSEMLQRRRYRAEGLYSYFS